MTLFIDQPCCRILLGTIYSIHCFAYFSDVFWSVLCGSQSIQTAANLHRESNWAVQGKETPWSTTSCVCYHGHGIQEYVARWVCLHLSCKYCYCTKYLMCTADVWLPMQQSSESYDCRGIVMPRSLIFMSTHKATAARCLRYHQATYGQPPSAWPL